MIRTKKTIRTVAIAAAIAVGGLFAAGFAGKHIAAVTLAVAPLGIVRKRVYASIEKVEDQDDGTIKVFGYASSGSVDSDGETVTPECMKAAIGEYMKFGAVREMHQASAAGTALNISVDDTTGKTEFGAHIVDPVAILKVKTQVYKGFSIGGKVTQRDPMDKKIIKGINLVEVSLVDRPANPDAVMTMFKAVSTPEEDVAELAELLDAGTVTPAEILELVKGYKAAEGALVPEGTPPKGGNTPAPVEPLEQTEIKKGMYQLADFASLLNSVGWLATDTAWEAQYEGDNSPLPASLIAWLKTGLGIFQAMAAEEAAELVASVSAAAGVLEAKAGAEKVAKAGKTFSKATKEALTKIHAACKEASAHLDGLGYNGDDGADTEDSTKVAKSADPEPTPAPQADPLQKGLDDTIGIGKPTELDNAIQKALSTAIAPLNEAIEKARKENEDLKVQVVEMGKRAAPGKALLGSTLLTLTKGQDVLPVDQKAPEAAAPAEGTMERASWEMRKVLGGGKVS